MVFCIEGEGKSCQAAARRLLIAASTVCRTAAVFSSTGEVNPLTGGGRYICPGGGRALQKFIVIHASELCSI